MANQNKGGSKARICPLCNQNPVSGNRDFCYSCQPEYSITGQLLKSPTPGKWRVVIRTAKNRKPTNLGFRMTVPVTGQEQAVAPTRANFQNGMIRLELDESDQKRTVVFTLDDDPSASETIEIPAGNDLGFKKEPRKYWLEAIPPVDTGKGWDINLTVYCGNSPDQGRGVAATVDVLIDGQASDVKVIPSGGETLNFLYSTEERSIRFSIKSVEEGGKSVDVSAVTKELTIPPTSVDKLIQKPSVDPTKGFLGNLLAGWQAGREKQ